MEPLTAESTRLQLFTHPYDRFVPDVAAALISRAPACGKAVVWWLVDGRSQEPEWERLMARPPGLPLLVLLPAAAEIGRTLPLLNRVTALHPRSVLPAPYLGSPEYLRRILASPPRSLADSAMRYLKRRGVIRDELVEREVRRILELAPETPSVTKLSRRVFASRRTLGRHFAAARLPVPSHWLQFARLLHITIQLQNDRSAVFRIATRAGYPDGFTMSNQMKRLIGYRPTDVRAWLGWEWVIEAWLLREQASGHLVLRE